jgi:hypothetical protein
VIPEKALVIEGAGGLEFKVKRSEGKDSNGKAVTEIKMDSHEA